MPASDRVRILTALHALDGYVVGDGVGSTVTDGWSEMRGVAETALGEDVSKNFLCAWWTEDAARGCFDADGLLVAVLRIHWRGDRKRIASALATTGLDVTVPNDDTSAFTVKPSPRAHAGEWQEVRSADLINGDVVDLADGIATVFSVVPDKKHVEIGLESGGGMRIWRNPPDERVLIRPRADTGPWMIVRAQEVRKGDVLDLAPGEVTITSITKKQGSLVIKGERGGHLVGPYCDPDQILRIRPRTAAKKKPTAKKPAAKKSAAKKQKPAKKRK